MDSKLGEVYHSPQGYWKGLATIKRLAQVAQISKDNVKKRLIKQALWKIRAVT